MGMETRITFLTLAVIFILTVSGVHSIEWENPPFLPGPPRPEVKFGAFRPGVGQPIEMDEEIVGDVLIAKFNYKGKAEPKIQKFNIGQNRFLGAEIRKLKQGADDQEYWYIVITIKQDFETPSMQLYNFILEIDDGKLYETEVFLRIINIDDNPPVIVAPTCQVPELYLGITNCTYSVTDADGSISINAMTFEIKGRDDEDKKFKIIKDLNGTTGYEMKIHLETIEILDYDKSQIHIFTVIAKDSLPNIGEASAIVQVIDVPNMPPIWKNIFATKTFDEKTNQSFLVEAIDGDTGINRPIKYDLYVNDSYNLFHIGEDSGILTVDPIDRDALKLEVFTFDITAYKSDNRTWETNFTVVMIVNDVNDNAPKFGDDSYSLSIDEETYLSLEFTPLIIVNDIDLGANAQYTLKLESISPEEAADAFLIIPNQGYQEQEFKITIVNATMLDFDNVPWQHVVFKIIATEKVLPDIHIGTATVTINLINWNDEKPIFTEDQYNATFLETVEKGYVVGTVLATDRDIGDHVVHSLVGNAGNYFVINSTTGVITVKENDVFDFHRQSEIVVQVKAVDTLFKPPYHVIYAQLTVNLIDVNNKQPTIRMPKSTPRVEENVSEGFTITDEIFGEDVDSTAEIVFSIDWSSSYATKQGRSVDENKYVKCVEIETIYPNPTVKGVAKGLLKAKEIAPNVTIDFEEFEVLYLTIKLKDKHQEIGDDTTEGTLTLIIIDLNDNPPEWVEGSLQAERVAREEAEKDVVIGSIQAVDIDGPMFNQISYSMEPRNGTRPGLLKINIKTGQIEVLTARAIDADIPKTYFLYYDVIASDCSPANARETNCWETKGQIEIGVIDTNNKTPFTLDGEFNSTVSIYENATGGNFVQVKGKDWDRDRMYNEITFMINYKEHSTLRNLFSVNETTGSVYVDLKEGEVLDRDHGVTFHIIYLILQDNYLLEGDRNSRMNTTEVRVILLDVNDNAPQLPPADSYHWEMSEDTKKDYTLNPEVIAPDIDDPDTDNSKVRYDVLKLTSTSQNTNKFPKDLFKILSPDNKTGTLITGHDLKGFWGTFDILIKAYDLGDPSLSSNETYKITVNPFNYEKPKFTYPVDNQNIHLAKCDDRSGLFWSETGDGWDGTINLESATSKELFYTNKTAFHDLHAEDPDGLEAGMVLFEVVGPEEAMEYFTIEKLSDNRGKLSLMKPIKNDQKEMNVTVQATDQGTVPGSFSTEITFTFTFLATTGDPEFEKRQDSTFFTELETGMTERRQLQKAQDPKNIASPGNFKIYYYIIDDEAKDKFDLSKEENILFLKRPLDRNEHIQYSFRIAASNAVETPESVPNADSILTVTVQVKEFDPRPKFDPKSYSAGITITDQIGKFILQLQASHSENLQISYAILWDTIVCDSTLNGVKDQAFTIDNKTGRMAQNFEVKGSMKGMFEFNVSATDSVGKSDLAYVKVFLISEDNRVSFKFDNVNTDIERGAITIAQTFTKYFDYICDIDYVLKANDDNGVAVENQTEVKTHFIENDMAIDASIIEVKKSDTTMITKLREELRTHNYYLKDIQTNNSGNSNAESLEKMLRTVLIAVSTVLGSLCIVLLVVYCLRTRSLNHRLKALSTVKFGSHDSGLNRIGVAVPGTNKHALEGSNPVWNEVTKSPDFDEISTISGDSDLIGVENSPQFAYDDTGYSNDKPKSPPNVRKATVYGLNEHGA